MNTITPEDRARLRDLAGKATPGPWRAEWDDADSWWSITGASYEEYVCPEVATVEAGDGDDANLIAAMRNALPGLLGALDQAEARIHAVRDVHRHITVETRGAIEPEHRCLDCCLAWPCPTIRALDGER